jgi:hypothetical protein
MKPDTKVIHISGQHGIVKKQYRNRVMVYKTDEEWNKLTRPSPRGPQDELMFSRIEDWIEQ